MVCLGLELIAAEWKAQTNPLSYGDSTICWSIIFNRENELKNSNKNQNLAKIEKILTP